MVNTVNVKKSKIRETGLTYKALSHSALAYQSSIKRLLAGFSIKLNYFQLRNIVSESD